MAKEPAARTEPGYVGLARKYRPGSLDEVVGQEPIVQTLRAALKGGRVAHGVLLAGPRGTGKTTVARILARCLNCRTGAPDKPCGECETCVQIAGGGDLDVLEIDGASNRRIDEVREIRAQAGYAAVRSRHRIFIIDEVHMLTTEAFNALLKVLEEPPAHVKFILATTHPHKVPLTVRSRCQRFDFRRIPREAIVRELARIATREGIRAAPDALDRIARYAEGGMRDALVLLEQAAAGAAGEVTAAWVDEVSGRIDRGRLAEFLAPAARGDLAGALGEIARFWDEGVDLPWVLDGCLSFLAEILRGDAPDAPIAPAEALRWMEALDDARRGMSSDLAGRIRLELAVARAISPVAAAAGPVAAATLAPATPVAPSPPAARAPLQPAPVRAAPAAARAPVPPPSPVPPVVTAPVAALPVVPAPAAADAPASSGALSMEEARARWSDFVAAARGRKRAVGALLLDAVPVSVKGSVLTIGFPAGFGFHRSQISAPDRMQFLGETLSGVVGRPVLVRVAPQDVEAPGGAAPPPPEPSAPTAAPEGETAGAPSDIVRRAKEIFGGRVL